MQTQNKAHWARAATTLLVLAAALLLASCTPKGKPRWATRLQPSPPGISHSPAPPSELVWLHVESAQLPKKGPGGEPWDDDESGPDPLVRVIADKEEILSFRSITNSFAPRWKKEPGANINVRRIGELRLELRDSDGLNSKLVGSAVISGEMLRGADSTRTVTLSPGGKLQVVIEPAHALLGLGFDYRHYKNQIIVVDILEHGPAGRSGVKPGDKLVKLGDKLVKKMSPDHIKSVLNTITAEGLDVVVMHKSGTSETIKLREGPIYALVDEYGPIP